MALAPGAVGPPAGAVDLHAAAANAPLPPTESGQLLMRMLQRGEHRT
jgi:hypothetical protein